VVREEIYPFVEIGCDVTGIDRSEQRILDANSFYASLNTKGKFVSIDFFDMNNRDEDNLETVN
jgi:hypothetical protein